MEQLFSEFQATGAAAWKQRLEQDLKGITFEQLSATDRNGIRIHPFYTAEDMAAPPAPVSSRPDWAICTELEVLDAATANKAALEALNAGVSGIVFIIMAPVDPALLLQDIGLPFIYTCFRLQADTAAFAAGLDTYIRTQYPDHDQIPVYVILDPLNRFLELGDWQQDRDNDLQAFLALQQYTRLNCCGIDAGIYQQAGATPAYELACSLAHLNEYLNLLQDTPDFQQATRHIQVSLATDTGFFEQIAKLRAFRLLSALVFREYGIQPELHIHVRSSDSYRSPFDSYSNLLRDTIAGMAAVTGGCNSLFLPAFDSTATNSFSQRMSRNQQLIFKEESYLDKVADIAAGAYYIEQLTDQLATLAWTHFKTIEAGGGLIAVAASGEIQAQIRQQAETLVAAYRAGKRVLIGVNKFPNPADQPQVLPVPESAPNALAPLYLVEQLSHA